MPYHYQRLTPADLPELLELLRVFGEAFGEPATYQGAVPSDSYLRALLAKPTFVAVVGRHDGHVIGGLVGYVLEKFEQDRRELYIYDLAVAEVHRRRGVATGLIRTLKDVAKGLGVYVMYVQADKVDAPAVALYDSLGRREDVFHFDIAVE